MRKSLFFKMDGLRHFGGCIIGVVEIREVICLILISVDTFNNN